MMLHLDRVPAVFPVLIVHPGDSQRATYLSHRPGRSRRRSSFVACCTPVLDYGVAHRHRAYTVGGDLCSDRDTGALLNWLSGENRGSGPAPAMIDIQSPACAACNDLIVRRPQLSRVHVHKRVYLNRHAGTRARIKCFPAGDLIGNDASAVALHRGRFGRVGEVGGRIDQQSSPHRRARRDRLQQHLRNPGSQAPCPARSARSRGDPIR